VLQVLTIIVLIVLPVGIARTCIEALPGPDASFQKKINHVLSYLFYWLLATTMLFFVLVKAPVI